MSSRVAKAFKQAQKIAFDGHPLEADHETRVLSHLEKVVSAIEKAVKLRGLRNQPVTLQRSCDLVVAVLNETLRNNSLYSHVLRQELRSQYEQAKRGPKIVLQHFGVQDERRLFTGPSNRFNTFNVSSKVLYANGKLTYGKLLDDDPYALVCCVTILP